MLFQPKVQTVGSVGEFLNEDREIKKEIKKFNKKAATHGFKASLTTLATGATAISLTNNMFATHAHAQATQVASTAVYANGPVDYVKGKAKEQILEAFDPLVELIQALSYPIASIMLTGGALLFMINQKDKGISLIQNASIGYILVQLMPLMMQLLIGIGGAVG